MRLGRNVPAYLVWIGLLLASFQAHAQQAVGSGAESNLTAQPVAGQQRAGLDGLPDSPGAIRSGLREAENQQNDSKEQSTQAGPATPQTVEPPAQSQSSLPSPQQPIGTAATGPSKVSGVAASQPSGVAVAPAKQRRARRIVLRVGAIVGAGAAVGTVIALTRATPSKPPGAR